MTSSSPSKVITLDELLLRMLAIQSRHLKTAKIPTSTKNTVKQGEEQTGGEWYNGKFYTSRKAKDKAKKAELSASLIGFKKTLEDLKVKDSIFNKSPEKVASPHHRSRNTGKPATKVDEEHRPNWGGNQAKVSTNDASSVDSRMTEDNEYHHIKTEL
eukprot:jgi/Bigna1/138804/aug1.46_g13512